MKKGSLQPKFSIFQCLKDLKGGWDLHCFPYDFLFFEWKNEWAENKLPFSLELLLLSPLINRFYRQLLMIWWFDDSSFFCPPPIMCSYSFEEQRRWSRFFFFHFRRVVLQNHRMIFERTSNRSTPHTQKSYSLIGRIRKSKQLQIRVILNGWMRRFIREIYQREREREIFKKEKERERDERERLEGKVLLFLRLVQLWEAHFTDSQGFFAVENPFWAREERKDEEKKEEYDDECWNRSDEREVFLVGTKDKVGRTNGLSSKEKNSKVC